MTEWKQTAWVTGVFSATTADSGTIYDYFEQCMIASTFSYQSLEAFSNWAISHHLKEGTIKLQRKDKVVELTAAELWLASKNPRNLTILRRFPPRRLLVR